MERNTSHNQQKDLRAELDRESKKFMEALKKGADWNKLKQIREKKRLISAQLERPWDPLARTA